MAPITNPLPLTTAGAQLVADANGLPIELLLSSQFAFNAVAPPFKMRGGGDVGDASWNADALVDLYAAVAAVNGTMLFPPGIFPYSSFPSVESRINIVGSGRGDPTGTNRGGTILRKTTDVDALAIMANDVTLDGFTLYATVATPTKDGLVFGAADATNGSGSCTSRNIKVYGSGHRDGVHVKNGNVGRLDNVHIQSVSRHGYHLNSEHTSVNNVNAWVLMQASAVGCGGDGCRIDVSVSNFLFGGRFEGNTGKGLVVNRPYNFITVYLESNTAGAYEIGASAFENFIVMHRVNGAATIANNGNYIVDLDGSGLTPYIMPSLSGLGKFNAGFARKTKTVTYSATMAIPAYEASIFEITATDGAAFTVSNPPASITGNRITIRIKNTSGGVLGTITWGGLYKMGSTWASPATGFNQSIEFECDGTNWYEVNCSASDVAN